ncbi:MAG: LemA family protein [Candidatus Paceibacterota bacterium]
MDISTIYVVVALFAIVLLALASFSYSLMRMKRQTQTAWNDFESELKKKIEIAMGVVGEIMKYAAFEKVLVSEILRAKKRADAAQTEEEKKEAGNGLTRVLKSVFNASEKYPDLKISQKFLGLKKEWEELQNDMESAKRLYNEGKDMLKSVAGKIPFRFAFKKGEPEMEFDGEVVGKNKASVKKKSEYKKEETENVFKKISIKNHSAEKIKPKRFTPTFSKKKKDGGNNNKVS